MFLSMPLLRPMEGCRSLQLWPGPVGQRKQFLQVSARAAGARLQGLRRLRFTPGAGRFRDKEVVGSLPLESRVALIMTFSGQYPGLPEFNEDILRCIFSFLMVRVASRLSSQPPQPSCSAYFCPARDSSDRYRLQCEDLFRPPLWQMWEMAPFAAPSACATSPACPTSCSTSKTSKRHVRPSCTHQVS